MVDVEEKGSPGMGKDEDPGLGLRLIEMHRQARLHHRQQSTYPCHVASRDFHTACNT
jgi:hypothetical protein